MLYIVYYEFENNDYVEKQSKNSSIIIYYQFI